MNVLSNKYYKDYDRVSRYAIFPHYYHRIDKKYIAGITAHLKNKDVMFVTHKVIQGDTLDSLALHYYNSPTYYWVIADFNRIQDPYEELEVGQVLRIPTFSYIEFDI